MGKPRIVATFTTLPDRYDILYKSMKCIYEQDYPVDKIYLTIPKIAARLQKEYPPLPEKITSMCQVIHIDIDYGPITKIYGALFNEQDPETIILSCDDDCIYDKSMVRKFLKHAIDFPNSVICSTGSNYNGHIAWSAHHSSLEPFNSQYRWTFFNVPKNGRSVDMIYGVTGVMYRRKFFHKKDKLIKNLFSYVFKHKYIYINDDNLISGYLNKYGIECRVFKDLPLVYTQFDREDALSFDKMAAINTLNQSVQILKTYGFFSNLNGVNYGETIACKSTYFIVLLILLTIFISIFIFINLL